MKTSLFSLASFCMTASLLAQTPATPAAVTSIDYRFEEVRRNVVVASNNQERRAAVGKFAKSGENVQTGWFSYARIASDRYRAQFEIFSGSDVQLAGNAPGVILTLERGRLHAMFDKLVGNEPRIVQTPGALLAVRGTKYVAEVNSAGETTLDVFEGTVEVQSPLQRAPMFVRAGEESIFSHHLPPSVRPMPEERRRMQPPPRGEQRPDGDTARREPQPGEPHTNPPRGGDSAPRPADPRGTAPGAPRPQPPGGGGGSAPRPQPPPPPRPHA
jgi:hypothetical protein